MGFDQYHEPAQELSAETRTFARMIASLTEEAEAIGWYEQRISLEPDAQAKSIMENAQSEEFKHFGMDLEFLLRRTPKWRVALQTILFSEGDIVERGEQAKRPKAGARPGGSAWHRFHGARRCGDARAPKVRRSGRRVVVIRDLPGPEAAELVLPDEARPVGYGVWVDVADERAAVQRRVVEPRRLRRAS